MTATALSLIQTAQVAGMTLWLLLALRVNLRMGPLNSDLIRDILSMSLMKEMFPAYYGLLSGRRPRDAEVAARRLFRLIVLGETLVALALTIATGLMLASQVGWVSSDLARAAALLAVAGFCGLWTGFLLGGEHFVLWLCHGSAQGTHFNLLLWGLGTQILLVLG